VGVITIEVASTILEAKDKLTFAQEAFEDKIGRCYLLAYAGFVNG
jgi:sulfite reductase (ferredoxin)